ncbi:MAG: sigma-54 dependent transcriptional regulator [Syntrophobacteraceae bacterium]|jgi:DNA-binding NtrC family response regulator|nr:sigma-54 dependent transcriptional regulator [Syntrophobacteraceae bacterium]
MEAAGRERLLIVDDEVDMLEGLRRILALELDGVDILTASRPGQALDLARRQPMDVILVDIRMPEMNGLDALEKLLGIDRGLTVIMMTAYGSIETAVDAIKRGAYDFITKPFEKDALLRTLRKGLERSRLIRENVNLRRKVCDRKGFQNLVGQSPRMRQLFETIQSIARSGYTVLVRGQSGTGKELVARAIHSLSPRHHRPLVTVNCPAIPEHLLESELFGHKKGAFTGADADQTGLFDEADGGSLLLDEIGDIPVAVQTKLLRALQEHEIKPLGVNRAHRVDVRIIASTNQDLEEKIRVRTFREDLFYRLNVVTVWTPSLDEIREDIPALVSHFTRMACAELGIAPKHFSTRAVEVCMTRDWPGNIRELQNMVRRAVMFCPDTVIRPEDLDGLGAPPRSSCGPEDDEGPHGVATEPYKDAKERLIHRFTLKYVSDLLEKTGGNVTRAAELSGLSRVALQKIMRRLDFKSGSPSDGDAS